MAITFNDNILNRSPKALDAKQGVFQAGAWRPYISTDEAVNSIPIPERYIGLMVDITDEEGTTKYWFKDGINNNNLVKFNSAIFEIKANQGLHVSDDGFVQLGGEYDEEAGINIYSLKTSIYAGRNQTNEDCVIEVSNSMSDSFGQITIGSEFLNNTGLINGLRLGVASITDYDSNISLNLTKDEGIYIEDTLFRRGAGDFADYSANKTDYSYVTKKMLDEKTIVANNGLHIDEPTGAVQLGGALTKNTIIGDISLGNFTALIAEGGTGAIMQYSNPNSVSSFGITPGDVSIGLSLIDNGVAKVQSLLINANTISGSEIRFVDEVQRKGAGDADDYSANKTDYSYITKKWALDTFPIVLDGLKEIGGLTLNANDLTIVAPVKWRIGGIDYEKNTDTVINIPNAADGFKRIDLIYADVNGNILRLAGMPTTGIAVEPTLPVNTVRVAPVFIDGEVIQQPYPDLSQYVTKSQADLWYILANPSMPQYANIDIDGNIKTNSIKIFKNVDNASNVDQFLVRDPNTGEVKKRDFSDYSIPRINIGGQMGINGVFFNAPIPSGTPYPLDGPGVGDLDILFHNGYPGSGGSSGRILSYRKDLQLFGVYDMDLQTLKSNFKKILLEGDVPSPDLTPYLQKSGGTMTGDLILSSAIPANALSAAPKSYIDNLITGLSWKSAVRVATTANITLSGTQTVDGVSLANGNRVLVKNQTDATQNGIYVVGNPWTRPTDADTGDEITNATVAVTTGTANKNTQWTVTSAVNTIGSDPITFGQISGAGTYSAGTNLTLSGNVFSVVASPDFTTVATNDNSTKAATSQFVNNRLATGQTIGANTTGKSNTTLGLLTIDETEQVKAQTVSPGRDSQIFLYNTNNVPVSITGNSATATLWNGQKYNTTFLGDAPDLFMAAFGGEYRPTGIGAVKSALGINDGSALNNVAASAALWNGSDFQNGSISNNIDYVVGRQTGTNTMGLFNFSTIKTALATSLQDVTSVRNQTTNTMFITGGSRPSTPNGKTLALETGSTNTNVFGYDYSIGNSIPLTLQGPGGNVGIGIDNPTAKLDVNGNFMMGVTGSGQANGFTVRGTGRDWYHFVQTNGNYTFGANQGDKYFFTNDGKYGINQPNPTEALHVVGNGKFTGDVEITDSSKGLILKDTALNTRHRISLTNGVLTVSAAL